MAKLGEELRERREERGLSAQDVREQLGIPPVYLEAMEGRGSPLIADEFYLIPYLRRYAEFLELNPGTVVARFLAESSKEVSRPVVQSEERGRFRWLVVGAILLLLITGVWLLFDSR